MGKLYTGYFAFFATFIGFLVLGILFNTPEVKATSYDENTKKNIKECIESFFRRYEEKYDNFDADFGELGDYYINTFDMEAAMSKQTMSSVYRGDIAIAKACPDGYRELNKRLEFNYTSIEFQNDMNVDVKVKVTKKFNYEITPDVESGCSDTYQIWLYCDGGQWRIVSIDGDTVEAKLSVVSELYGYGIDSLADAVRERIGETTAGSKSLYTEPIIRESDKQKTKEVIKNLSFIKMDTIRVYNRKEAASYAQKYAISPNPHYYDFSGQGAGNGGDCTNFVSQCLHEGGSINMHNGAKLSDRNWYYNNATDRSTSWTGASQFQSYLLSSGCEIDLHKTSYSNVTEGDVIQLTYKQDVAYHSMIVTKEVLNSNGERSDLLICCHTNNRKNIALLKAFPTYPKIYYHIEGCKKTIILK